MPQRTGAGDLPSREELERLTPRALLRRLGLRPRRGLSQNFLTDPYVVRDIVAAAELTPDDEVLEVGPGLGVMTRELVAVAKRVVAVELDQQLAEVLPRMVPRPERLEVVPVDVMEFDPAQTFAGPFKVVANLPYHITSAALRKLLTGGRKPSLLVVMVQREVAERMTAAPGATSVLSIMVQLYSKPSVVRQVPREAFYPSPEVASTVLKMEPHESPPVDVRDREGLMKLVAAAFSRRRKQIHNALAQSLWFPAGGVAPVLESAGIAPERRAQTLTLEEWARLYRAYEQFRSEWKREGAG